MDQRRPQRSKSPDFIFKTSSPALKNTPFVKSCKNEHNADDWFWLQKPELNVPKFQTRLLFRHLGC